MKYCNRCLYPENAKPTIIFDEEGVCSGCRYHESRMKLEIDWQEREEMFREILDEAKDMAKERGNHHDCIVPVSGGKDSHFQVWLLQKKYKMNPLLVTFNHGFNTRAGNRNLRNLVEKSGCDLIRYTAGPASVKKLARYMLERVGDITWHFHAGIQTFPFQVAVERNIPLIVWGEHGFAELTGVVSLEDFVEHTRWKRKEHDMRGLEPEDLVGKAGITREDIAPYIFPSDEALERTEVRGIYLSNFVYWDAKAQTHKMMDEWGFSPISYKRERTFNIHGKIEDHANDVHDYLKYLKFGYGRATDDASMEIRHGRMTREQGMALVKEYDPVEPSTLQTYCDFMGISKDEFYQIIEPMRDETIWKKDASGQWQIKDAVWKSPESDSELIEKARPQMSTDAEQTFSDQNRDLYFNPDNLPSKKGEPEMDNPSQQFEWM